ncbi:MAG TPA: hypothetical protein VKT82_07195 [Ktedonobacterales bacterium]|nr:hypothetical protein [Ktedonobacterales bacterium]
MRHPEYWGPSPARRQLSERRLPGGKTLTCRRGPLRAATFASAFRWPPGRRRYPSTPLRHPTTAGGTCSQKFGMTHVWATPL